MTSKIDQEQQDQRTSMWVAVTVVATYAAMLVAWLVVSL